MNNKGLSTEMQFCDWIERLKFQLEEIKIEHQEMKLVYMQKKENSCNLKKMDNKIICGDSLEILRKIPDETIDLIVTSPPYNIGMGYDKYNDRKMWSDYLSFL